MNYLNDNLPFNAVACNLFTRKNKPFLQNGLTDKTRLNYINPALAKSRASRGKLNLYKANDSTPFNRAFFVRGIYAPIQYSLFSDSLFSMVARNGQPLAVGCLPCMAVFHPVTCYRPTVESLAVVPENLYKDTAEMIYKFLCVNRTHPHFNLCIQTIHANTEESARLGLNADFRHLVTVAKINPKFNRTLAMKGGIYA
ncbi:TPA: ash family protein [Haemophilus influenzae 10810]|uniref:ash family protein n=1 Tax=Haemophilus influenzae TaxID=727 RepID=UPI0009B27ACA|nr:ash family protein [Haemophilus influenzae]MCK9037316.1 ash family protein [Haemophilus influenzae]MCK9093990.1 ash family protein [Haemophilus influenzae]PRJ12821.1 Ash protein family protein [Haemophilus influenzae]PRJ18241.1 Ash protein family protein [Haemophilus influenzae]PRJ43463.1 Ash protein family protein [Haemophilus influenzae]